MFAAMEQAIVDRLTARFPDSIKVASLAELSRVPELRNKAPAVFVVFEGYEPAAVNTNVPHIQQVVMSWAVVCVAKNASGGGENLAAKGDVSDMAGTVLESLLGFMAAPSVRLNLAGAPGPEYDAGFCYLPIGFSCRSTFKGDPG